MTEPQQQAAPVLEINEAGYPTGNWLDADGNRIPLGEVPAAFAHAGAATRKGT
jgi:hypothetical protein